MLRDLFGYMCNRAMVALRARFGRPAPETAVACNARGVALAEDDRFEAALDCYRQALVLRPDSPEVHNNTGFALAGLGRHEAALESYSRALGLRPGYVVAHLNRSNSLAELNRHEAAMACLESALAIDPGSTAAQWNLGLLRLQTGDFARGWPGYESRLEHSEFKADRRDFAEPRWTGRESLAGRTILVYAEQGLGDTLQFCRYVELVAARGATVLFEVQPPLKSLLSGLRGASRVLARGEPLPAFDLHCPLLSLPLAFGTVVDTVPAGVPYVLSDPALVQQWGARLGEAGRLKVGLAWSANSASGYGRARSMGLAEFAMLLPPGAQGVSLQKDLAAGEPEFLAGRKDIVHFGTGFADTAALAACMDVIVSVDTSIAHLAGAMGLPTWVLMSAKGDWRWLRGREDSPWYPSVRVFREPAPGDREGLLRRVRGELGALAAGKANALKS